MNFLTKLQNPRENKTGKKLQRNTTKQTGITTKQTAALGNVSLFLGDVIQPFPSLVFALQSTHTHSSFSVIFPEEVRAVQATVL